MQLHNGDVKNRQMRNELQLIKSLEFILKCNNESLIILLLQTKGGNGHTLIESPHDRTHRDMHHASL